MVGKRVCEVCGIHENRRGGFFASFPLDENRCRIWVKLVGKEDLANIPIEKLHKIKSICRDHFVKKDFNKKGTKLKKRAYPKLNLFYPPLTDNQMRDFPLHVASKGSMHATTANTSTSQQSTLLHYLNVADPTVEHNYGLQKMPFDSTKSTDNIGIDGDDTCASPSLSVEEYVEEKLNDESDVPLCAICLRANRSLKAIEDMASFYNELSHHKLTEDMLVYCSECETTLKKCYNFKRKCTEASTLLKFWVEYAGMDRPPKTHLLEELGPPPLEIWNRDNIGIYYFKEPDVTKTNEKFEFNIAKSGSGEINSMIMVTYTDKTDIIEKAMDADSEVNTTIKSEVSDDAASIDPLGDDTFEHTNTVDANPSVKLTSRSPCKNIKNTSSRERKIYKILLKRNNLDDKGKKNIYKLVDIGIRIDAKDLMIQNNGSNASKDCSSIHEGNSLISDGNSKRSKEGINDVTEYEPILPKSILERIKQFNSKNEHDHVQVVTGKTAKNIQTCNNSDKKNTLPTNEDIGDSQSREKKRDKQKINVTNSLKFLDENADNKNIVTYEIVRENNVIVKEVVKISPTARSNENKYRNYEKFKALVELAKVDATSDNQGKVQDFVSIEANDNIDAQENCQDTSEIIENDICEEVNTNNENNNYMNLDDQEFNRNEDEKASDISDSFSNHELPIPYKTVEKYQLKKQLKNIFEKYTETLMTKEGYTVNKNVVLCFFGSMCDEDLWKLHKVVVGARSFGNRTNTCPEQLINVLAALQQKYETQHADKFDVVYLNTDEEVRREFENKKTYRKYLELKYKCEMCFTAFDCKKKLENHMNLHSPKYGSVECDICHVWKKSEVKLNVHRQSHLVVFKCKLCPMVTNLKSSMKGHVGQHEGEGRVFVCEVCGYTFNTERAYKIHKRRHWDNVCEFCGVCFSTRLLLDKHRARRHRGMDVTQSARRTRCEQCLAVFASRAVCNKHRARAHTNKGFPRFSFFKDSSGRKRIKKKKKPVLDQALNLDQTPNAPVQILSNFVLDRMVEDSGQIFVTVKCTSQGSAQELVCGENLLDTSAETTYIAGQTAIQNQTESLDQSENNVNQTYDIVYHDDIVEQTVEIVDQSHNEHNTDQITLFDKAFQDRIDGIAKRVKKPQHSQEFSIYSGHKSSKKRSQKLQNEFPKKRANIETCARRNTAFASYLDQALDQYNAVNDMPELD